MDKIIDKAEKAAEKFNDAYYSERASTFMNACYPLVMLGLLLIVIAVGCYAVGGLAWLTVILTGK